MRGRVSIRIAGKKLYFKKSSLYDMHAAWFTHEHIYGRRCITGRLLEPISSYTAGAAGAAGSSIIIIY
jgi:hypothetical protein